MELSTMGGNITATLPGDFDADAERHSGWKGNM
jgi:hypothetical protein